MNAIDSQLPNTQSLPSGAAPVAPDARLMKITARPSAVMSRGAGSYLWDERDNRYLDFIQGWAVNGLGHAPSELTEALHEQSQKLISPSPALQQ